MSRVLCLHDTVLATICASAMLLLRLLPCRCSQAVAMRNAWCTCHVFIKARCEDRHLSSKRLRYRLVDFSHVRHTCGV